MQINHNLLSYTIGIDMQEASLLVFNSSRRPTGKLKVPMSTQVTSFFYMNSGDDGKQGDIYFQAMNPFSIQQRAVENRG